MGTGNDDTDGMEELLPFGSGRVFHFVDDALEALSGEAIAIRMNAAGEGGDHFAPDVRAE